MNDTMLLAVPSMGEGGLDAERSGHFGHADAFTLVQIAEGEVAQVRVLENPPHEHGGCLRPVELLAAQGVNAIVVAGMGARPWAGFKAAGIEVYFENQVPMVGEVVRVVMDGGAARMDESAVCGGHGGGHGGCHGGGENAH